MSRTGNAGKAIRDFPREQVVLASKWGIMIDDKFNFSHDASPEYARKSLELSLKNMGVHYVDLYILWQKNPQTAIEDSVRAMAVSNCAILSKKFVWSHTAHHSIDLLCCWS